MREIGPGATMDQLARAGGVTKPILYRHFGDRDGLIAAMAHEYAAALLTSVTEPLGADAGPRATLQSTVDAYVSFIERDPSLYRFLVQTVTERQGGHGQINALMDDIAKRVATVAGNQLRAAGRDSASALPWAYGIVGLVHQAGDWWLSSQTITREALVDYLVTLLWDGLGASAAPAEAEA